MAWAFAVIVGVLAGSPAQWARGEGPVATHRFSMPAKEAFEKGMGAWGARMNAAGTGAVLYDHVLVEDDGSGIGSSSKWLKIGSDPAENVAGQTWIKKVLHVERPGATEARLYLSRGAKKITFNGKPIEDSGSTYYPVVPPGLVRKGDNEVVVHCDGNDSVEVKIAPREQIILNDASRKGRPKRSYRSTDGGKTWQAVDGEYMVRLHLKQHVPSGHFVSPAIDLGKPDGDDAALLSDVEVHSVGLKAVSETPRGTDIEMAVRSGPCPVYDRSLWSDWRQPATKVPAGHRYLQWKATLRSSSPLATPVLKGVTVEAKVSAQPAPSWAGKLRVTGCRNAQIRYTSIPFEYEAFDHPRLVELRKKYKLDEVVSAGETELEKFVLLRNWVANQWRFKPPYDGYPAWDAHEILKIKYGFCVQYAIVYVQACMSLGYPARFVFGYHSGMGAGHEVTEVWSNEHRKWVFMDPSGNRHHVDPNTLEPLSMLEIHDRMMRAYYGEKHATWQNRPKTPVWVADIGTCSRLEMKPSSPAAPTSMPRDSRGRPRWPAYMKWQYVRYMPRNNWYAQTFPMPRIQGWNWDWIGYWSWEDPQVPLAWKFRNFTHRRSDVDWTINQVRFDARYGSARGTVTVQMGTSTPGLGTYLVSVDDGDWKESGGTYTWKLHPGRNRLGMRVRNTAGVQGPVSFIEVEYKP